MRHGLGANSCSICNVSDAIKEFKLKIEEWRKAVRKDGIKLATCLNRSAARCARYGLFPAFGAAQITALLRRSPVGH